MNYVSGEAKNRFKFTILNAYQSPKIILNFKKEMLMSAATMQIILAYCVQLI